MPEGDDKKLQARLIADQAKPVPLRVAASVVQQQLSASSRDSQGDANYQAVLDSTALALSHVADIHYINSHGRLVRIPSEELAVGMFEGGAKLFRTRSGNVYDSLSMRRADMQDALAILKRSHQK